jgi:hypothetical protein
MMVGLSCVVRHGGRICVGPTEAMAKCKPLFDALGRRTFEEAPIRKRPPP